MKLINLTMGFFAQVDDEDFEWLNQWKWYAVRFGNTVYVHRATNINGKRGTISMHRQILELKTGDDRVGDHRDHNGLNNQRINLRIATRAQNQANKTSTNTKTSKYLGVHYNSGGRHGKKPWVAMIGVNYKQKYIGNFEKEVDAAKAYNEAAIKIHSSFANLNIINDKPSS